MDEEKNTFLQLLSFTRIFFRILVHLHFQFPRDQYYEAFCFWISQRYIFLSASFTSSLIVVKILHGSSAYLWSSFNLVHGLFWPLTFFKGKTWRFYVSFAVEVQRAFKVCAAVLRMAITMESKNIWQIYNLSKLSPSFWL